MHLTREENGLVFDYFFRCAEQELIDDGSVLITSNSEAAAVHSRMKQALAQLEYLRHENCPDKLVDLTISRLKLATVIKSLPYNNGALSQGGRTEKKLDYQY